jgi:metallophosphoesterase (TIGR03768 family)
MCLLLLVPVLVLSACAGGLDRQMLHWPISSQVFTTADQQILPVSVPVGTPQINPGQVSLYAQYGYSAWQAAPGLSYVTRTELAPDYKGASNVARLLSFFTMTDIHIADKESPAQIIYQGLAGGWHSGQGSTYSPVVLSTTHVLDAAVQTINALHRRLPFDFGISLGDDCNNNQYNELRWFIDVFDGKVITPSSGANLGASTIDYQIPYKAAGLNPAIPWYQVIGNHDQFFMGGAYESTKALNAHVSNTILNMGIGSNHLQTLAETGYYMGVVDGSTPYGDIIGAGPQANFLTAPTVVADPNRHSLSTATNTSLNWMREFFTTTSNPVGHGFTQANLNDTTTTAACYSVVPKSSVPIKIISLDDTCTGPDQPEYVTACLDTARLTWLKNELQAGQDKNQLMIIAAHIPINPQADPNNGVYYGPFFTSTGTVVNDAQLLSILHTYPNLIMWIAGHRHVNVVTPQPSPDPTGHPEQAFWQVETASLRDFPQQFRAFDIRRNTDNTISIIVTDVDPAVSPGSPAAKSRGYAIGATRIYGNIPLTDTTSHSYNAELVKQLTPAMQAVIANSGSSL